MNTTNSTNSINDLVVDYAKNKGFHRQTLDRWLGLGESDRQALLKLTDELKLGENHFRDFLEWLEEISLRDRQGFGEILTRSEFSDALTDPRLGRSDQLKRVKEALRRLRFPRLAKIEEEVQKKIRELKLKSQVVLSVPPGLEGGTLSIQLTASSHGELKELVEQVEQVVERDEMREIFSLLKGEG